MRSRHRPACHFAKFLLMYCDASLVRVGFAFSFSNGFYLVHNFMKIHLIKDFTVSILADCLNSLLVFLWVFFVQWVVYTLAVDIDALIFNCYVRVSFWITKIIKKLSWRLLSDTRVTPSVKPAPIWSAKKL